MQFAAAEQISVTDSKVNLYMYRTPRQNVVVYARMLTYNDEEPWPQNFGAVAIAN